MFKGLPNYFDLTSGNLLERIVELKEFVSYLLTDENYKKNKFAVENFQKEKSKILFKEIESYLKSSLIQKAESILNNNVFLESLYFDYVNLLKTIVLMSKKPIKDMDIDSILLISRNLKTLEKSSYQNIALYLESMLTKSYFDFNGIRNNVTQNFNDLKIASKKVTAIKPKYFLMTRNIKNIVPYLEYELLWL